MSFECHVFPGMNNVVNRGCSDWSHLRLFAYGSFSVIHIVDMHHLMRVQSLDGHPDSIVIVKWCPNVGMALGDGFENFSIRLASADVSGTIFIWNVKNAQILADLSLVSHQYLTKYVNDLGSVFDMYWHPNKDNLLVALYENGYMILWDTIAVNVVWISKLNVKVDSFFIDPFIDDRLCFCSQQGNIYFNDDFNDVGPISKPELKYELSNSENANEFISVRFSNIEKHIVFFIMLRKIVVYDLYLQQDVGLCSLERNRSAILMMYPCKNNDMFYTLHLDGSICVWERRETDLSYTYNIRATIDLERILKQGRKGNTKIYSISLSPSSEHDISCISEDGTLLKLRYFPNRNAPGRIKLLGMLSSVYDSFGSMHINPWSRNLAAIGTLSGTIQILDLIKKDITFELKDHVKLHLPIKSILWIDLENILYFTTEKKQKGRYINIISIMNVTTGYINRLIAKNEPELSFIRGFRVSPSKEYLLVLYKEQALQVWHIPTARHLRTLPHSQKIFSIEWCTEIEISENNDHIENFIFSVMGGSMFYYSVMGHVVNLKKEDNSFDGAQTSLIWKGDLIISANLFGVITFWYQRRRKNTIQTSFGTVRKMILSPGSDDILLVHFSTGEFSIWNLSDNTRIATDSYLKSKGILAKSCSWITENRILLACSDESLRIVDLSVSKFNSTFTLSNDNYPLYCPLLLPNRQAMSLKTILLHFHLDCIKPEEKRIWLDLIPIEIRSQLKEATNTIQRSLIIANYFGDEEERNFWLLAQHSLQKEFKNSSLDSHNSNTIETVVEEQNENENVLDDLPGFFDVLRDGKIIKAQRIERSKHINPEQGVQNKKLSEFQILIGNKTEAIQMLLETPSENQAFYISSLKACVIAATMDPINFHNTVKLVATNLIANGSVDEGVQLLCLIDKSIDACRYLQSYDRWDDAAWLAKTTLPDEESSIVMYRWADNLTSLQQNNKALQIYLSLGEYQKVIQLLVVMKKISLASQFIHALVEHDKLKYTSIDHSQSENDIFDLCDNVTMRISSLLREKLQCNDIADYYETLVFKQ